LYWKQQFPDAEIVAFEPDPVAYEALSQNVKSHNLKKVNTIKKGVWKKEGTLKFSSEGSTAGRLEDISKIASTDRPSDTISVPTARLRNYLNEDVDLLKIDIEGAEYEVIKDCADLLLNVKNIFVEYHSFSGKPQNLSGILRFLSNSGFRYHIKPGYHVDQPFTDHASYIGMDNQVNIYAYR
jgi:FkbM family methyltransferase